MNLKSLFLCSRFLVCNIYIRVLETKTMNPKNNIFYMGKKPCCGYHCLTKTTYEKFAKPLLIVQLLTTSA